MPHRSTLARSTAKGKVRPIVTGPGPGSRAATSAGVSTPLTDTRTTLPGSRRGVAAVGAGVNRDALAAGDTALGVGLPSPDVALGPQADKRTINATAPPLIPDIVPDVRPSVMRVAPDELVRLGRIARQRVPAADERVVLVDHRDVVVVDRGGKDAWVL